MSDVKEKSPLIIAGVLVVIAIVWMMRAKPSVTTGSQVVQPNNSSTDAANAQIAAANASSAQQYDQLITQEFGQMVGFGTTIQNNITQTNLATIQAKRDEQIAATQAQIQQTMYNDQLAAIQAQQNAQVSMNNNNNQWGFWGSVVGTVGAIFGL